MQLSIEYFFFKTTNAEPIAPPPSPGAYGINTFLILRFLIIFPFADELRAHPPDKHKLFDL